MLNEVKHWNTLFSHNLEIIIRKTFYCYSNGFSSLKCQIDVLIWVLIKLDLWFVNPTVFISQKQKFADYHTVLKFQKEVFLGLIGYWNVQEISNDIGY